MTRARELAELASAYDSGSSMGFRNRIINGDMRIDQRNAGASVNNTAAGFYTLDRWRIYGDQAAKFSVQQNAGAVTPPVGFSNYLGATSLSAYTVGAAESFTIHQMVEGFNVADLAWGTSNAVAVTVSFWVRSSLTGTFGGSVFNSATNRSYPFSYTINAANTWEQKTLTIPGDTSGTWLTNNGIGLRINFSLGAGSSASGTAGTWSGSALFSATGATSVVGTNAATFYITGVQLEAGSVASPFERRDYGRELMMCQRYYYKAPASSVHLSGQVYIANSVDGFRASMTHPVAMRAAPTVTVTNFDAGGSNSSMLVTSTTTHSVCLNLRSTSTNTAVWGICGLEAAIEL